MDIMKIGAQLLMSKLSGSGAQGLSLDTVTSALGGLLSGGDGKFDVLGLVSRMQSSGLAGIAASWLGDGPNQAISGDQVRGLFGSEKIAQAASMLKSDEGTLLGGLSQALPEMIDKSSSGGSLLDAVGGIGGALGMAKKLFG